MRQQALFNADELQVITGESNVNVLRQRARTCQRCPLAWERTNSVFGTGNTTKPKVAFVGEAPGYYEDQQGEPFVGPSGKLLNRMLDAMRLRRRDIYICNTICCRPPGNRKPEPKELQACRPYLEGQLDAIQPGVIVALGASAIQALLGVKKSMHELREGWHEWRTVPLKATFHPAYLLRVETMKHAVWEDMQEVMARIA